MEDRQARLMRMNGGVGPAGVLGIDALAQRRHGGRVFGIAALGLHLREAGMAQAGADPDNVQKDAIALVARYDFFNLLD